MPKTIFKTAAWADIISAILVIPAIILGLYISANDGNTTLAKWGSIGTIIGAVLSLLVLRAYHRIAQKYTKLGMIVGFNIAFTIVLILISIQQYFFSTVNSLTWDILFIIIQGLLLVILGIKLIKTPMAKLAKPLGIMYIVLGALLLTVFFAFFGILLSIPVSIVESIMFFKLAKKKRF